MLKDSEKKILDRSLCLGLCQNVMGSFLAHVPSIQHILWKSVVFA